MLLSRLIWKDCLDRLTGTVVWPRLEGSHRIRCRVWKPGFDVTEISLCLVLAFIPLPTPTFFNPLGERSWLSPAENGSAPAPARLGILALCFNICPDAFLHHFCRFLPRLRRSRSMVTCLYILLAITTHSAFSRLLTISSRLHLNNLRSRLNLRHNPFPLGCANLSKFSFQNSELQYFCAFDIRLTGVAPASWLFLRRQCTLGIRRIYP
jgi:hypothetical protein